MLGVLSGAGVVQAGRGRAGQFEGVVEFTVGEESGVTGDGRAVELQLDLAVEVKAQGVMVAVTHWVPRSFRQEWVGNAGFSGEKAQTPCRKPRFIWEMWVHTSVSSQAQTYVRCPSVAAHRLHQPRRWPPRISTRVLRRYAPTL